MTLQSAIEAHLPFLRAEAEARMTSRCVVMRKTGGTEVVDGFEVDEWAAVHVDLPVRRTNPGSRGIELGGVFYEQATGRDDFPADTTDLEDGDYIEITAGEWVGEVERIVKAVTADQKPARRVPVQAVARPEEWE